MLPQEFDMVDQHNPKTDPDPQSNTEKDPDDWVTGDEPMTGTDILPEDTVGAGARTGGVFRSVVESRGFKAYRHVEGQA